MASKKITALPNWGGAQVPTDLLTAVDLSQPAATENVKTTLDDLFSTITKNITDISVQWQDGDGTKTVSAANNGKLAYSQGAAGGAGSFQVSENGAAYQNLLKGVLTATLMPVASAADILVDSPWAVLGSTTARTTSFNASTPGTSLSSYLSPRVGIVELAGGHSLGILGLFVDAFTWFFAGTLASPSGISSAGTTYWAWSHIGQYDGTAGHGNEGVRIVVQSSQAFSSTQAGSYYSIANCANGSTTSIVRLGINQLGCVHIRPTIASGASTSGTSTLFQVGGSGYTTDNNAISFFADATTGGSAATKNIVAQQKGSQTGALFETQSASAVAQFGLYPQVGTVCHFIVWAGSTNTPSVSAGATEGRIFVDGNGLVLFSQGQATWGVAMGRQALVKANNYTVLVGDTGGFLLNTGAVGTITYTLPAIPNQSGTGNAGIVFTFYARTNQVIVLQLPAATILRNGSGATSAAGTATSTAQFDKITIVGTRDGAGGNPEYITDSVSGTWTLA
jgi:hypothetical protein